MPFPRLILIASLAATVLAIAAAPASASSNLVFSGQLGGPMAGLIPLVGEILGVERAPIAVEHDGLRHSVRVGAEGSSSGVGSDCIW